MDEMNDRRVSVGYKSHLQLYGSRQSNLDCGSILSKKEYNLEGMASDTAII